VRTQADRLASLTRLADAATLDAKAAALALGAASCIEHGIVTVLLFDDDGIVVVNEPAGSRGFALRDGSAELRRLFLHALARFGEGGLLFVPRGNQRAFAGVGAVTGESDLLFAPLSSDGTTLGVVAVALDGEPDLERRTELNALCSVATRMLEVDRALAIARRQSRDSQLLAMVNERLHKSLDRRDVLFGIVEGVRSAFSADRCFVYERLGESEHATVVASAVKEALGGGGKSAVALDADLRKVFAGLTVRRDDLDGGEVYGTRTRSAMCLPFVVDGRVENALVLAFDKAKAFDDADVAALRSLAFHVGLALSNARLYERERARRSQAESLERVVRILRDTQYLDEVVLVFVVTVSHELPLDCAAYALEDDTFVRRAMRLRDQGAFEPAAAIDRALLEPFLAVGDPTDVSALPRSVRDGLFDGRSGAIVPLRLEGGPWGFFLVRMSEGELDWPPAERATFFRTLGSHLEIALANAHAYERELRRAQERETFAEAARMILSHTTISTLADVMCRLATSLVHADRACVLRWDGVRYAIVGQYGVDAEEIVTKSGFDLEHRAERLSALVGEERRVQRLIDGPGYLVTPLSQATPSGVNAIDAFLLVGRGNEERFSRDDLRIMQELGALLTLALRNLELYEAMGLANRALQESSEFKDDLLAMLAHDFKGPLTVILGYCELLLETTTESHDEIETVYAQTKRLVRLSEDALILAQTQAEGFSLARTTVDFGSFVAECVEATAPGNPRLVVDVPEEPLVVELDPHRFRHVIENLVSNALKYSTDAVDVSVEPRGENVAFIVHDRGIGIPEAELSALFTRFGRASNARSRGISGSGIGLYVSRKIVEVHRGSIAVESRENEGSTFTVTLPTLRP
jgi:signal transduction histidine kinase